MRARTLLLLIVLSLAGAPLLLAQTPKPKKTLKKKAVQTAAKEKAPAPATPTPSPAFQPMAEPTREGVTTEAKVQDLDGTIMVQHPEQEGGTALQTGSTVEKGDDVRVYEGAWVILKSRWGDRIGLIEGTEVSLEEYYFEGPDRQIRLILRKGSLLFRTNDASSRQSFFEVQAGPHVVSLGDSESRLDYDPTTQTLRVQYLRGKVKVVDQDQETKLSTEGTEMTWEAGKKKQPEGTVLDEMDVVNFERFFRSEDPLLNTAHDILLTANDWVLGTDSVVSDVSKDLATETTGNTSSKQAREAFKLGRFAYQKRDPTTAKYYFQKALDLMPNFTEAQRALDKLRRENPGLK